MEWVRMEGSREGPHLLRSSGGESVNAERGRQTIHKLFHKQFLQGHKQGVQIINAASAECVDTYSLC